MPLNTCPTCQHVFPSVDVLASDALPARCTQCTRNDALAMLDNLEHEFRGSRVVTSELFEDGGALATLYNKVDGTNLHSSALLRWQFERAADKTRQGKVLAYLAQAIRNDAVNSVESMTGEAPNVVVAITLVMVNGAPRFVVGVNGHEREREAIDMIRFYIPDRIAGVDVDKVTELAPHGGALSKRLGHIEMVTPWNWHAEQKVLRHVKNTYGTMARLSATSMGIAHVSGPCTPETARDGTNYCFAYLKAKHDKDDVQLGVGGGATHGVAAYWYAGKHSSQVATLASIN